MPAVAEFADDGADLGSSDVDTGDRLRHWHRPADYMDAPFAPHSWAIQRVLKYGVLYRRSTKARGAFLSCASCKMRCDSAIFRFRSRGGPNMAISSWSPMTASPSAGEYSIRLGAMPNSVGSRSWSSSAALMMSMSTRSPGFSGSPAT